MISFHRVPPIKPLYLPLLSPLRATCPAHFIIFHLIIRLILGEEYTALSFSLCSLVYSSLLPRCTKPRIAAWKIQSYTRGASITKNYSSLQTVAFMSLFCGATDLTGPRSPHGWGFEIAHSQTARGVIPLYEWSSGRTDLYLTTHNIHKRQKSMPPARFEPAIPPNKLPRTDALESAATGIGSFSHIPVENSR